MARSHPLFFWLLWRLCDPVGMGPWYNIHWKPYNRKLGTWWLPYSTSVGSTHKCWKLIYCKIWDLPWEFWILNFSSYKEFTYWIITQLQSPLIVLVVSVFTTNVLIYIQSQGLISDCCNLDFWNSWQQS